LSNRLTDESGPITLQWSDPIGQSANDYDIYVLNSEGTAVIGSSDDIQDGNDDPFEIVNPQRLNSQAIVVQYSGQPRFLNLNTNRGRLAINTRGQVWGHAAAVNAISVAAVNAQGVTSPFVGGAANPVETFSSDGPRRIFYKADGTPITPDNFLDGGGVVRPKPNIAAADGVMTTLPSNTGLNPFFGTSAAAPHAAAVAALLKSFRPSLTPAQTRIILNQTALDIEATGVDQDSGHGIVMADRALQRAAESRRVSP
jgi:subtilisin family serine protease